MMGGLLKQLIYILLALIHTAGGRIVFEKSRDWNNEPGSPAIKVRLTKHGADYLKNVGVKILNEEIPQLRGFRAKHSFSERGISGEVLLYNVNVIRYMPAYHTSIEFSPPSSVVLDLDRMSLAVAGRFSGNVALLPVSGSFNGDIQQMSVHLQTQFKATRDGLIEVKVVDCLANVQYINFLIVEEGPLSGFIKIIEAQINALIKEKIPGIFCKSLQRFIEEGSPRIFQRLSRTNLSDHFKAFGSENFLIGKLLRRFIDGLYLDNRNVADPIITFDYFEILQKGEIRYENDYNNMPFFPPKMRTSDASNRMLYLYGSQYVFNSLLYHAYEQDRMVVEIDESVLPEGFKSIVRTNCSDSDGSENFISSICLGKLIPEIADRYPSLNSSVLLLPHKVPSFQLQNGFGSINLESRILTYIKEGKRRRQILVSSADLQADLRMFIEQQRFAATLRLNKFDVRSAVKGLNDESITQLAPLAKTFLGPQLAKALRSGIPFPLKESVELIGPQLTVYDNFIEIATDFKLNEFQLREKIREAFAHNLLQ